MSRWPHVVMTMVVLGSVTGVGGAVAPAGAAPAVGRVVVGPIGAGAPVTVTAVVSDPDPSGVVLEVIVGFGAVVARPMADDGRSGDGSIRPCPSA